VSKKRTPERIEILPEIDRQELAGRMALRKFRQDEVIYHQGDPAARWVVVFEGPVKRLLLDDNGRALLISLHSRGEFQIDRDGSLAVLKRNEEARTDTFERLSRNVRKLEGQVADFAFST
jgi:signal-transduction protein with cAMP-binding, CBS, and nucleotidyltransferase domain